jgi:hypothetical protein
MAGASVYTYSTDGAWKVSAGEDSEAAFGGACNTAERLTTATTEV